MTIYTPDLHDIPTGLDEVGYRLGLPRLPLETPDSYRRRLLAFSRKPPRPDDQWFRSVASSMLGLPSINVLDVDLVLDGSGVPVAADPRIEVTSTHLRTWDDYANGSLDLELDLVNDYRFLTDVHGAFAGNTYFSISALDADYGLYLSKNLRVSNSDGWMNQEVLAPRKVHKFEHPYVVNIFPDARNTFQTEVASMSLVNDYGKFYLNRVNGVVHTYEPMRGIVRYSYWDFSFRLWWDAVRVVPLIGIDTGRLTQELVRSDIDGSEVPGGAVNDFGARLYNELLRVYPMEWGK